MNELRPSVEAASQELGFAAQGKWSVAKFTRLLRRFVRAQPLGTIGGIVCLFLIMLAAVGPLLVPHDPQELVGVKFLDPEFGESWNNWGTDWLGRDVFSRVIAGARISIIVGFTATFWGTTVGLIWGLLQGYWGGAWFDTVSQRLVEAMLSIPSLVMALTFMAIYGPSLTNVIIALGIRYVPSGARTIRSQVLSVRESTYIDAARGIGASNFRIIAFHILPNVMSIYLVLLSLHVGGAIIGESSLSFLGLGAGPNVPSWGGLVSGGTEQALSGGVPWLALFPGFSIILTVYGFNLFGDALRDVLDPRLRGGRGAV